MSADVISSNSFWSHLNLNLFETMAERSDAAPAIGDGRFLRGSTESKKDGDPRVDRGVRRRVTDTAVDLNAAEINDRNAIPDRMLPRSHNSIPPKVYPECTVFHAAIDSFETSSAHCNNVSVARRAIADRSLRQAS
jgi:hypothetical protein